MATAGKLGFSETNQLTTSATGRPMGNGEKLRLLPPQHTSFQETASTALLLVVKFPAPMAPCPQILVRPADP